MTELEPLRFSRLKKIAKSPAHYLDGADEDTGPLRKGSALHSLLLGNSEGVYVYKGTRNKKHKKYQEFLADKPEGAKIMSPKEMKDVDGMRRAIEKHPRALQLLNGVREQTIEWEMGGRACRGTPDVVHLHGGAPDILVELKSAQSAKQELFRWQCRKLGYHSQVDWYSNGLSRSTFYRPSLPRERYIVAVESTRPYPVVVYRVTDKDMTAGRKKWRYWFEQLLVCERTGVFPAYAESDVDLDVEEEETELDWEDEEAAA